MCHKSRYSKSVAANRTQRTRSTLCYDSVSHWYPTDFKNERNERVIRISNRMEYRNKIFTRNAAKARSDFLSFFLSTRSRCATFRFVKQIQTHKQMS